MSSERLGEAILVLLSLPNFPKHLFVLCSVTLSWNTIEELLLWAIEAKGTRFQDVGAHRSREILWC